MITKTYYEVSYRFDPKDKWYSINEDVPSGTYKEAVELAMAEKERLQKSTQHLSSPAPEFSILLITETTEMIRIVDIFKGAKI